MRKESGRTQNILRAATAAAAAQAGFRIVELLFDGLAALVSGAAAAGCNVSRPLDLYKVPVTVCRVGAVISLVVGRVDVPALEGFANPRVVVDTGKAVAAATLAEVSRLDNDRVGKGAAIGLSGAAIEVKSAALVAGVGDALRLGIAHAVRGAGRAYNDGKLARRTGLVVGAERVKFHFGGADALRVGDATILRATVKAGGPGLLDDDQILERIACGHGAVVVRAAGAGGGCVEVAGDNRAAAAHRRVSGHFNDCVVERGTVGLAGLLGDSIGAKGGSVLAAAVLVATLSRVRLGGADKVASTTWARV